MKYYNFTILSICVLGISSCGSAENTVQPKKSDVVAMEEEVYFDLAQLQDLPYDNVEVPKEKILVPRQGGVFHLESGHTLTIPETAFTYLDGSPVTEEVEIRFESFKSADEIILSGISMKYDSAATSYDFISAGMYKIEGFQNDQPVAIAKGKSIEIDTYSYEEDAPCYNFYQKDTSGNWNYLKSLLAKVNPNFPIESIPVMPKELSEDDIVFNVTLEGNKYIKKYENYMWKYDGGRSDTIDLKKIGKLDDPKNRVEIVKSDRHQLAYDLIVKGKKNFNIPVSPGLYGDKLEEAIAEFNKAMESIAGNGKAAQAIADGRFVRSVSIPNFGMYNCDRVRGNNQVSAIAEFTIDRDYGNEFLNVFLVSKSDNSIVNYSGGMFNSINYNPDADNSIIVTLPDNEVAVITGSQFNTVVMNADGRLKFDLRVLDTKVTSSEDFKKLMDQI
ncbi:MAG: hypothetical protein ACI9N1_001171 [Flavobacteriales bacterium]|jgi:hypothetical protein